MVVLELTVQVLNLSPKVNLTELKTFFSYCGTVENVKLRKNNDGLQEAFVTFSQPYAFQTALLLNGAILGGKPIRILPLGDIEIPITVPEEHEERDFIPVALAAASKGAEVMSKTKDEFEELNKLSVNTIRKAINDAEQKAEAYASAGAKWLSRVLDKASQRFLALSTRRTDDPDSRKRK